MKTLVLACFLFIPFVALRAENCIQNGDFAGGTDHWYGDGKTPSEFASPDPLTPAKYSITQGLAVPLKTMAWSKLTQNFETNATDLSITITYSVTSDFSFSDKASYYTNISSQIGQKNFSPFSIDKNHWLAIFCDKGKNVFTYYPIEAPDKTEGTFTFTNKLGGFIPHQDKTIILAFPPGNGLVILQSVVVSN